MPFLIQYHTTHIIHTPTAQTHHLFTFLAPEEGLQIITFSVGKTAVLGSAMQVPPSAPNGPPAPEAPFEFAELEEDDETLDPDVSSGARPDAPTKVKTTVQVTTLCAVLAQ